MDTHTNTISDTLYISEMFYNEEQEKVRQVKEIGTFQGLPADLPVSQMYEQVKLNNKKTRKSPPNLTKDNLRPAITDTEIALIHACYYTIPHEVLAHILNLSTAQLKDIHNQTQHTLLPSIPMVMITDTSRYLSDDNINELMGYPSDSNSNSKDDILNEINKDNMTRHDDLEDPYNDSYINSKDNQEKLKDTNTSPFKISSNKELLRISKTEQAILEDIEAHITSYFKKEDKETSISLPTTTIQANCNIDEVNTGINGEAECLLTQNEVDSLNSTSRKLPFKNYHSLPFFKYVETGYGPIKLNIPSLYQKFNFHTNKLYTLISNKLLTYYSKVYLTDEVYDKHPLLEDKRNVFLSLPLFLSTNLNVVLNKLFHTPTKKYSFFNPKTNITSTIIYKDHLKGQEKYKSFFDKDSNEYITYTYHKITKPHFYERAFNAKLFNSHNILNFIPDDDLRNNIQQSLKRDNVIPKCTISEVANRNREIKLAIVCPKCHTLLSQDTTLKCPHITLKVSPIVSHLQHRKPKNHNKFPMVVPFILMDASRESFENELITFKDKVKTTTKYDYLYKTSQTFKDIYTIYIDQTDDSLNDLSIHIYNHLTLKEIDIPLYEYITKVSPNIKPLFTHFKLPSKPIYEP